MLKWLRVVAGTLRSLVKCRRDLALENLARVIGDNIEIEI
jgi:hypothetical protein